MHGGCFSEVLVMSYVCCVYFSLGLLSGRIVFIHQTFPDFLCLNHFCAYRTFLLLEGVRPLEAWYSVPGNICLWHGHCSDSDGDSDGGGDDLFLYLMSDILLSQFFYLFEVFCWA